MTVWPDVKRLRPDLQPHAHIRQNHRAGECDRIVQHDFRGDQLNAMSGRAIWRDWHRREHDHRVVATANRPHQICATSHLRGWKEGSTHEVEPSV